MTHGAQILGKCESSQRISALFFLQHARDRLADVFAAVSHTYHCLIRESEARAYSGPLS